MAIQKEIWAAAIVEGLFASNSFLSKAFNADEFVNQGKVVHIPQAGAPSGVEKNRSKLPASVERRGDDDVTFTSRSSQPILSTYRMRTPWSSVTTNAKACSVLISLSWLTMWHVILFTNGLLRRRKPSW